MKLNYKYQNIDRVHNRLNLFLSVITFVLLITGCGDFRDEAIGPTPTPVAAPTPEVRPNPPIQETPSPKPPITQNQKEGEEQRNKKLCEAERVWALESDLIDLNQMKLYQTRNFGPVFNTPGERQSGIEGWVACERALKINGFIQ